MSTEWFQLKIPHFRVPGKTWKHRAPTTTTLKTCKTRAKGHIEGINHHLTGLNWPVMCRGCRSIPTFGTLAHDWLRCTVCMPFTNQVTLQHQRASGLDYIESQFYHNVHGCSRVLVCTADVMSAAYLDKPPTGQLSKDLVVLCTMSACIPTLALLCHRRRYLDFVSLISLSHAELDKKLASYRKCRRIFYSSFV